MQETTEAGQPTGAAGASPETRVLQRVLVDRDQELDVRPLYVGGVSSFAGAEETTRQSGDDSERKPRTLDSSPAKSSSEGLSGYGFVNRDGHVVALPQRRVTFGTYFNSFPASYWRRWTDVETVRLVARARGEGTFVVYRSTAKGHVFRVASVTVDETAGRTLEFELPLKPFIDGGWYWFDIEAGEDDFVLEDARWETDTDRARHGTVTIGITTYNRPEFCVDQLVNFADHLSTLDVVDKIVVVDQGTDKIVEDDRFAEVSGRLGDRLEVIEQGNLGGSGGFSRAMLETASRGASDYVLLLDDDVVCELAGIERAVTFADLARTPTIVGGHMFSLYVRSLLHAFAESVGRYRWFWGPAANTKHGHDFARQGLRETKWLHRRVDADYNGWWMCLIPTEVIRRIGMSLPYFIKWDDAEYSLRASEAGFPTVSLPGVAVWHVPWTDKDDSVDWQAYFHERNRLITALLHSPYPRGGRMVRESFEILSKHTLSMQYSTAELMLLALSDVLDGPERMHEDMLERLPHVRRLRAGFDDSQAKPRIDDFPTPRRAKPPRRGRHELAPVGGLGKVQLAATGLLRQALPAKSLAQRHPEVQLAHADQKWWRFMQFDSALVSTADGTSVSWYKRSPEQVARLTSRSAALHARLYAEWPALAERYRAALGDLVGPEAWKSTIDAASPETTD